MILFVLGALVAYWTLPKALNFLLGFAGQQFAPLLTADRFLSFVMLPPKHSAWWHVWGLVRLVSRPATLVH